MSKMSGDLLQREKQGAGTTGLDAIGGKGVEDFEERNLYVSQGFKGREMQEEGFGATTDTGDLLLPLVIALVEVTEFLAAKGGRAAKDAIGLAMAAGGTGHKNLQEKQLAASN
jgi:hypothetical protein